MKLSVLIPARNEQFLKRTIDDLLENIEDETEIIAVLDGQWAKPAIPQNERVKVLYFPKSIGQRAATNQACRLSKAKYVMKLDAHCAVGKGFDRILIEDMQDDWTVFPYQYNLHAFNWKCKKCGHERYQGPSGPCEKCNGETFQDMKWKRRESRRTSSMRFDTNLKFQYWGAYQKEQVGNHVESMSCLGACWMLTRERYWELEICDERHGSWGQQGTEVACKSWLSGGKLICNKRTWFAHMFRTQGGDFGFPYSIRQKDVQVARNYSRDLWFKGKWNKAVHDLKWLIDKFNPPEWDTFDWSKI